jgi:DnaJ family protein C protein 7
MDCSPYQAEAEQVSREASVGSDQFFHVLDSSVLNQKTSRAEDDLVSATENLVIDADLPTYQDEGRDRTADASESNFGSNFSSFDEEINFCDVSEPLFTNMSVGPNSESKMFTTEAWVDDFGCNTCEENTSKKPQESVGPVSTQSSSENLSGLNFTFGASLYPESSITTQRRTTKRKLRTKGSQVPKPSATHAPVPPKSSQDTKNMQLSPETSGSENLVKEQLSKDASVLADLETCETWRTRFVQTWFYFVFISCYHLEIPYCRNLL